MRQSDSAPNIAPLTLIVLTLGFGASAARADHDHSAMAHDGAEHNGMHHESADNVAAVHDGHSAASTPAAHNADMHAAHREAMADSRVRIDEHDYTVPDVELTDQNGSAVSLQGLLASDRPLAVNFIFTTCTTICPVMTATWVQLRDELSADAARPQMISISIDPTYDTPDVMRAYAEKFGADWTFLTGSSKDIALTLRAFDASRGSKVNHFALNLLRPAGQQSWTRVEGLSQARALADVWRNLND